MEKRGRFIVLEGIDGSGTTTQAENLKAHLESQGKKVHLTRQPSTGVIGKTIREFLAKKEGQAVNWEMLALLFAADRLHHWDAEIEPHLRAGDFVISDRYVLSSLVYQGEDCPEEWVAQINQYAPQPDLTFWVNISAEAAFKRVKDRGGVEEVYDDLAKQQSLEKRYARLAPSQNAIEVNGDRSISEVTQSLCEAMQKHLGV